MKWGKGKKQDNSEVQIDRSVCVSNARIDRNGVEWQKKSLWLRGEYLGKLKVMAHFQDTKMETLVNKALGEYLAKNFDNSMAMKKMVAKSTGKLPTVKI